MTTENKQPNTTEEIKTTLIEIPTNGITSGKMELSIFNFTYQKKRITTPFFPILTGKPEYDYDHHIDGERLNQLGKKHKGYKFFSFDKRGEQKGMEHITIQSYGELMKYELYRLISSGKLSKTIKHETGEQTTYKMTWTGNPIEKPELKTREPKEKKDKKPKQEQLEGLDFFN